MMAAMMFSATVTAASSVLVTALSPIKMLCCRSTLET
jgi:hypothetical protein